MADSKGPTSNPVDDLKALIFIVALLWLLWLYQGGPAKYEDSQGVLLKPSWPVDTGESYGEVSVPDMVPDKTYKVPQHIEDWKVEVPLGPSEVTSIKRKINLSRGDDDSITHIILEFPNSNKGPLNLADFRLRGLFGRDVVIGKASNLPYQGKINTEEDVLLSPGSTVFIINEESPLGVSFRVNKCFGHLAEFQKFFPPISSNYTAADKNYNSCVKNRMNDEDFFINEWYIYLGDLKGLWNETGDIIRLIDKEGRSVSSMIY